MTVGGRTKFEGTSSWLPLNILPDVLYIQKQSVATV